MCMAQLCIVCKVPIILTQLGWFLPNFGWFLWFSQMLFLQTKLDLLSIFFSMSIGKFPLTFAILGVSDSFSGSSHHHQSHKAMEDCHISQSIPRYLFEPATLHEQNPANQLGIFTHTHTYMYIYIYTHIFSHINMNCFPAFSGRLTHSECSSVGNWLRRIYWNLPWHVASYGALVTWSSMMKTLEKNDPIWWA